MVRGGGGGGKQRQKEVTAVVRQGLVAGLEL